VKARIGETECRASVGGELVAEGEIRFMLVDVEPEVAPIDLHQAV
jgi:hypothetical protein